MFLLQAGDVKVEVNNAPVLALCLLTVSSVVLGLLLAVKYRDQVLRTFHSLSSLGSLGAGSSTWSETGDSMDGSEGGVKIEMNPIYDIPPTASRVRPIGPYDVYSAVEDDTTIETE